MANILILKDDHRSIVSYESHKKLNEIGLDQYEARDYKDLVFDMSSKGASIYFYSDRTNLAEYDLVYLRDPKEYERERNSCAIYLNSKKKDFINRECLYLSYRNKLSQCMKLNLYGSKIPRTLFCRNSLLAQEVKEQKFDFPIILKAVVGQCGENNFLIKDQTQLKDKLQKHKDIKFIVEEFIPNDFDYRIIVFREDILCAYERDRSSNRTHLNNVSRGAERKLVDISPEISNMAIKAAKQHDRDLCGVDIVVNKDTGEPFILETNANFDIDHNIKDGVEKVFYKALSEKIHKTFPEK